MFAEACRGSYAACAAELSAISVLLSLIVAVPLACLAFMSLLRLWEFLGGARRADSTRGLCRGIAGRPLSVGFRESPSEVYSGLGPCADISARFGQERGLWEQQMNCRARRAAGVCAQVGGCRPETDQ